MLDPKLGIGHRPLLGCRVAGRIKCESDTEEDLSTWWPLSKAGGVESVTDALCGEAI